MRLLNVRSRSLRTFLDNDVPPYAILSHTWGKGEIRFQDIEGFIAPRWKAGWKKLDFGCRQAIKDHLDWIWIDTCCIDKTSSAELSEAINSMFAWYHESTVCYAYLSDVDLDYSVAPRYEVREAIRPSRWFTRGWTLQELIAPDDVMFFNASWSYLGTRSDLASIIADITAIDKRILDHDNPHIDGWYSAVIPHVSHRNIHSLLKTYSIAEKMSWAARRETTRVEDRAYSLLGLFNITMPLLYGERDHAFRRLQESIIVTSTDPTILAWGLPPHRDNTVHDDADEDTPIPKSDSQSHGAEIFAPDPGYFEHSAHVVRRSRLASKVAYAYQNLRLAFHANVLRVDDSMSLVVLNCCYRESRFGHNGALAMPVVHDPVFDLADGEREERPILWCWLPKSSTHPFSSRLTLLPKEDEARCVGMDVRIQAYFDIDPKPSPTGGDLNLAIWTRSIKHPSVAKRDVWVVNGVDGEPTVIRLGHGQTTVTYAVCFRASPLPEALALMSIVRYQAKIDTTSQDSQVCVLANGPCVLERAFHEDKFIIKVTATAVSRKAVDTIAIDIEILRPPDWEGWAGYQLDSDGENEDTEIVEWIVSDDFDEGMYAGHNPSWMRFQDGDTIKYKAKAFVRDQLLRLLPDDGGDEASKPNHLETSEADIA